MPDRWVALSPVRGTGSPDGGIQLVGVSLFVEVLALLAVLTVGYHLRRGRQHVVIG